MLLFAKVILWILLILASINSWQQFDKLGKVIYIRIKGKRNEQIRSILNVILQIIITIIIGIALLSLYYI